MTAEAIGGWLTGSLSLLSDAAHMLTDAGALGLALFAIRLAEHPAGPDKTFGYYRAEILAALANGIILFGVSGYILYEAYQRFLDPPAVRSLPMLVVATVGLAVNVIAMVLLRGGAEASLNVRAAYLEVLSDLLGSIGVIAGAVVMMLTGWYLADPIVASAIGLFILPRTWRVVREAVQILLEGTPPHLDSREIARALASEPGVIEVHDLHVWSLTSGFVSLSAHVVVAPTKGGSDALLRFQQLLRERFGIQHSTLQLEPPPQPIRVGVGIEEAK
jgi:cobalt-zinc-cadmium efflux system protein